MQARVPEPELMDTPAQTQAYVRADFSESNQNFVDQLLSRYAGHPHTGVLYDLGCGPADIIVRLAHAMPGWRFVAVDGGPNMLACARDACTRAGLTAQVSFHLALLPDPTLPRQQADAIVSNSVLHHLPDPATLWQSIQQLGKPGAYYQVMDLIRPPSRELAHELVATYASDADAILRDDFFNSLLAAYTVDEVQQQLQAAGLSTAELLTVSDRHWLVSGRL